MDTSSESKKFRNLDCKSRIDFLEKELKINLENIKSTILKEENCKPNIENMIGSSQIPLGIAGPVRINGEFAQGSFYLPLSTSEGALVASINRGCSAISKSGGASSIIISDSQTRSLLFKANSIPKIREFLDWLEENSEKLKKTGEQNSKFIEIQEIKPYVVGLNIWLRIKADTKDAMGMNMITIAGKQIAEYISKNFEIEFLSETGNLCVDKKPSTMNLINSRGKKVIASVNIPENVIKETLKTTSDKLVDLNYRKNLLGSAVAGNLGFNAHFANMIAAMFIATGQDAAHVVDGSLGFTTVEKTKDGVNFSVTIPSLQIGTVGGGTKLPTQKECLSILGVEGTGNPPGSNSKKLAEIIATAVLAGEISLLSALTTKNLAESHKRLNR